MPDVMRQGYEYWNRQFSERPAGLLENRLLDNLESQGMLSTYDGPSVDTLAKAAAEINRDVVSAVMPGEVMIPWDDLTEQEVSGWRSVAMAAIGFSESSNEGSAQWAAQELFRAYWHGVTGSDSIAEKSLSTIHPLAQLAWEAVARHLAAMVMDGEENSAPPSPEGGWGNWAKKKMEPLHTTP